MCGVGDEVVLVDLCRYYRRPESAWRKNCDLPLLNRINSPRKSLCTQGNTPVCSQLQVRSKIVGFRFHFATALTFAEKLLLCSGIIRTGISALGYNFPIMPFNQTAVYGSME